MTHKSLWSAVHASELKRYTHDGGRGAERLPRCLFCRTYQDIPEIPKICSEYINKTIIRAELDQWDTNQI